MNTRQALQKLDDASKLLNETKTLINESENILKGDKTNLINIKQLCKQGELFENTPICDEKLFHQCFGSLVETI
jgi:hypothetical protein